MERNKPASMKPRRLKGHKGALTCCIASRARPGIIASSGELYASTVLARGLAAKGFSLVIDPLDSTPTMLQPEIIGTISFKKLPGPLSCILTVTRSSLRMVAYVGLICVAKMFYLPLMWERSRFHLYVSKQDGCICWFDLLCKDVLFTIDVGKEPISSFVSKQIAEFVQNHAVMAENEDVVYASSGTQIACFDIHMAPTWKPLETYSYNKEEINQIAFSSKSYFLAAADDSGDVKIIDTRQQSLYKTLRAVHTSICSSVQFLSWKPWAAITGGLDSKLAMWDFSRGRAYKVVNYGMPELDGKVSCSNVGQCFNPAFIHSIAVPEVDTLAGLNKVCAVARGDGVIDMIEIESESASTKSRNSSHPKKGSQLRSKDSKMQAAIDHTICQSLGKRMQLDYALGGHTAAVSCVSFSLFGERGRFLVSGGNDAAVKLWDWSKHFHDVQTSSNSDIILNINVNKKVNWLCTTPSDSENLIVCDTSKILKAYTVP